MSGDQVPHGLHIGGHCRIGANTVPSPEAILAPETIAPRLALVDQSRG